MKENTSTLIFLMIFFPIAYSITLFLIGLFSVRISAELIAGTLIGYYIGVTHFYALIARKQEPMIEIKLEEEE